MRKLVSILLTLAVAVSLCLVAAAPVTANPGAEITSTNIEGPYVVGVQQQFTVRTTSDTAYASVLFKFVVKDTVLADIDNFQYYYTVDSAWHDMPLSQDSNNLVGYFGPPGGFAIATPYDATTLFRVTFNTAKAYEATASLVDLSPDPDVVITSTNFLIVVEAPSSSVGLTAAVPDIVAISVSPTNIDFGTLYPGDTSAVIDITVNNIGTHKVDVDVSLDVSSDGLFKSNLEMRFDSTSGGWSTWNWPKIITGLAMSYSNYVQTKLSVPSDYTPLGTETATLIFEATGV